ncbi:G-alpha-domain-containing protein [Dendrothele bispora CBS 962.96]|uniref:G-alpha-domain-containing protein n=1 Tax=Dendrothele bispora (strain CBS 962.96) TaxID=1314807 RepID=A0A4S8LNG9_DENBC|nr:G-alpha-domain-containing protein [Dendrothele bispora CBS 962.96]
MAALDLVPNRPNHGRSASAPPSIEESGVLLPPNRFYNEESQRISNMIDDELKKESALRKEAKRKEIKVMLLGQAESGKSTLQKQFQLYYASQSLEHERPSWKPIVHFNIIKAVRMILDEIEYEVSRTENDEETEAEVEVESIEIADADKTELMDLRKRLLQVVALHDSLASELSGGVSITGGRTGVFVRSGWQTLLTPSRGWMGNVASTKSTAVAGMAAKTLNSSQDEIRQLWSHPVVKKFLDLRRIRLEESAPFFLDNLERIVQPDYVPGIEDVLSVRLQTLGVIEHSFPINLGGTMYDWRLYDVGGARGQRHAWVPYFDDATAIIFLAPISAFDQYLEEDPRTNRIDDSLQLFTAICSNQLLNKAHLVLMLNKTDLLKQKLKAGIKVAKYITSYGKRPNKYEDVSNYFRAHFIQIHKRKDISNRALYVHFTSMLDIKATQSIIVNVGEAIIRQHIAQTGLA